MALAASLALLDNTLGLGKLGEAAKIILSHRIGNRPAVVIEKTVG